MNARLAVINWVASVRLGGDSVGYVCGRPEVRGGEGRGR